MKNFFSIAILLLLFSSCSEFQKAFKSEDVDVKYKLAEKLYNAGKYDKAIRLFEQISSSFRGKPESEKMYYMYAQSFYKTKQYLSSGYQFESFVSSYPKSDKAEECYFLGAVSYSKLSPIYSLDQGDTYKAIDKFQNFIDQYPTSIYMADANLIVKALREKIELKAFEVAKQYNDISDYKSSMVALNNFIIEFPGTPYKEKALYYRFDSAYYLAVNSISTKMESRLNDAVVAYNSLIKFNPNSEFKTKADKMLERIETELKQFSK